MTYPKIQGASDLMDSAMFAGLLALTKHPKAVPLTNYLLGNWEVLRCPVKLHSGDWSTNPNNVTLDQIIPVVAGLLIQGEELRAKMICKACKERGWLAQNIEADKPGSKKPWWNGPDRIWFAQREFMNNILNGTHNDYWLQLYIKFHARFTPMKEPHQLLSMILASCSPKMYLTQWTYQNSEWRECLKDYWTGWRNEPEFCEYLIKYLEGI